jgi:glycosyltransferase involved in cell wall biosynthesis
LLLLEDFPGVENRLQRQMRALTADGHEVRVFCCRGRSKQTEWEGVRISRSLVRRKKEAGMAGRFLEYLLFPLEALLWVLSLSVSWRPQVVQAANMPDWLVFSAAPAKLLNRARVVLDLHDLMPELLLAKHGGARLRRILEILERASVYYADGVMTSSPRFIERLAERTARQAELVPNGVDTDAFPWRAVSFEEYAARPARIVYHGTIAERFGLFTLVAAAGILRDAAVNVKIDVYGDGDGMQDLRREVEQRDLAGMVELHGQVPFASLAGLLPDARLGIVPYVDAEFMSLAFSNKSFEYTALGVPVVASDLPSLRLQLNDCAWYFDSRDPQALADTIRRALADDRKSWDLLQGAQEWTRGYAWEHWSGRYLRTTLGTDGPGQTAAERGECA